MDQEKFVQLLQAIQIPDTDGVKAATAELKNTYYPNPQSLLWLLQLLISHDSPQLRQQAAVEASRLVPKHWNDLPDERKPAIRAELMKVTMNEETTIVRHSDARVVSAIAKIDLEDGEWADLPSILAKASTSSEVRHREVGVYILFTLLEAIGDGFTDKLPSLFGLFSKTIQDPESQEVRINTMMALSRVAMLIEPDEDPKSLESFQEALPAMVSVLKDAVDEGDDDRTMQAFEVFQTLLGCESALLAEHFKDLVQFMVDLAVEKNIAEESRSQALSFLMQCVKYRRMKIQGIKDMGEQLTTKSMQIVAEMSEDDDEDDITPARSALGLLDLLASSLPPRQVIVPLLKELPHYVNSENPSYRKAGILALGMSVEGAPDFIATQLSDIMPIVLKLLHDPDVKVRQATLHGVTRLADDLAEDMNKAHADFVPALLKNLESALVETKNEADQKTGLEMVIATCTALEALIDGMETETIEAYAPSLVPHLGRLFGHPDYNVKAAAAGAMGSVAGAAEEGFLPYFEPTMKALSQYVGVKDSQEELVLRAAVCDTMGRMATAVGSSAFQPYVQPLMQASEEGLHLDHPRLRETSYILWSTMAKLYKEEFTPFLDGVVKGLYESLEQVESDVEVELGEHGSDLIGQELVIEGKKIKVTAATDDEIEDVDPMEDDDDDDDWDDLNTITAVALEKEISVEVLGDIIAHTGENFIPYLEKSIEIVASLVDHSYEGIRKAAFGTLWRAYASLWELMEAHSGEKWKPGIPLQVQPSQELVKLGEVVSTATMQIWGDDVDRSVITEINRNVADTLKLCGPAILTHGNMLEQITTILSAIVNRQHPCQMDLGDEEDQDVVGESSEYDWLVIDTALDVIVGLSAALGTQFGEIWKMFEKSIIKMASSPDAGERSTATGAIGECIAAGMKEGVTPYTEKLIKVLLHRLSDEDPDTKSNAAYGMGLLITHSTDSAAYLPNYNQILSKLEPLLSIEESTDNAAGCVSRMIIAHPERVPVSEVIPALVRLLPLKKDFLENKPIYECIVGLYQHQNSTIREHTRELMLIFAEVLSPPEEQLDDETREKVKETVRYLAKEQPELIKGNDILMGIVRG